MKTKRTPLQTSRPAVPAKPFPPRRDYASLSVRDLLDARDAYHVHLSMLENVVSTAIGRYLIHEEDWYATNSPEHPRPKDVKRITKARTLDNSLIRPWSWPAVLVFVKQWKQPEALGAELVPKTLYMPDGRVIPTCVIEAAPDERRAPSPPGPFHVSPLLGGGYACLREHQGQQSLGTFGCLVRKGGSYYALTNRHVAGGENEEVRSFIRGKFEAVGKTSNIAVDRLLMPAAFPGWSGERVYLTLDAGLIKIDNVQDWTSQAFGVGELGDIFDATPQSVTLDLIGCPVRGFGAVSGVAEGEVRALFLRYRSAGGFDNVTDLLIGPRRPSPSRDEGSQPTTTRPPLTRPGDSGMLWFYDPPSGRNPRDDAELVEGDVRPQFGARARRLRPVGMQWGGNRVKGPEGATSAFALASFLSTICRSLDVELVRSWSIGHDEYWGKIGHFAIGWKACDQLSGTLGTLMELNQERIGFDDDRLGEGSAFRVGRDEFVPLADVPDYKWLFPRAHEGVQHFADVDIHTISGGPTLLAQCMADPKQVSASAWKTYFDGFATAGVGPEQGALPFRVWQLWQAMVDFLGAGDALRFVAAAGVLAHYVGDASQPLHSSYLHHGVPPMKTVNGREYPFPHSSPEFAAFKKTPPAKIHAIYEQEMLEVDPATALASVDALVATPAAAIPIASGHDAAVATVRLMHESQARLAPQDIVDADDATLTQRERAERLWANQTIQDATIASLAGSVRLLAALWATAWAKGNGDALPPAKIKLYSESALEQVCRQHTTFVPSLSLEEMVNSGNFEAP